MSNIFFIPLNHILNLIINLIWDHYLVRLVKQKKRKRKNPQKLTKSHKAG